MRKRDAKDIGTLIRMFMRSEGIETPYNEYRIVQAWPQVMGEGIAKYTGHIFIKNQTLHIQILSSVLRNELNMGRQNLIKKLNEQVGAQVITNIRFY